MQLVSGAELPSPLRLLQVLENLIETSAMFFNHLNIIKFFLPAKQPLQITLSVCIFYESAHFNCFFVCVFDYVDFMLRYPLLL